MKIDIFIYFKGQACSFNFLDHKIKPNSVFQELQINPILPYL